MDLPRKIPPFRAFPSFYSMKCYIINTSKATLQSVENTRNWICDTVYGAISSIHVDLFEHMEWLYSSQQIEAYIGARDPECYENGYILV